MAKEDNNDLIDKDISFQDRNMHKMWPMIKGCALFFIALIGFIWLSVYVFKHFF